MKKIENIPNFIIGLITSLLSILYFLPNVMFTASDLPYSIDVYSVITTVFFLLMIFELIKVLKNKKQNTSCTSFLFVMMILEMSHAMQGDFLFHTATTGYMPLVISIVVGITSITFIIACQYNIKLLKYISLILFLITTVLFAYSSYISINIMLQYELNYIPRFYVIEKILQAIISPVYSFLVIFQAIISIKHPEIFSKNRISNPELDKKQNAEFSNDMLSQYQAQLDRGEITQEEFEQKKLGLMAIMGINNQN